jgi:hypothetical protein
MDVRYYKPNDFLKTALLFIVFNRLDTTRQVFEKIRKARPPLLYVAADGPRPNFFSDREKVKEVRDYVVNNIDWSCEVKTLFSEHNLGCRYGPIAAINWFFENEESGIILEDDCLPSLSFFWYCEELLKKHRHDQKVFGIGGELKFEQVKINQNQYGFVGYPLAWGWASWRRAWQHFNDIPSDCQALSRFFPEKKRREILKFWISRCEDLKNKEVNWWDYQLGLAMICNQALWAFPPVNLVSNIGFGPNATHTKDPDSPEAFRAAYDISLPLQKNNELVVHKEYNELFESMFTTNTFYKKLIKKGRKLFSILRGFNRK